jgi:hypothetical protein
MQTKRTKSKIKAPAKEISFFFDGGQGVVFEGREEVWTFIPNVKKGSTGHAVREKCVEWH